MKRMHIYLVNLLPAYSRLLIACQVGAILLIALIAGSTFGIWQGYNHALYSPATFLEVHQGAVRGLNTLLPAMGFATMILTLALTLRSDRHTAVRWLYWATLAMLILAGLITRFANQPINMVIMTWSPNTMPDGWAEIRDTWWFWHIVRTFVSFAALAGLATAVVTTRHEPRI